MKKQIVFIEYFPMIHTLKIAKGLRESGKYETVLISFNKFDKNFFGTGYDKIINLEISQRPSFKNISDITKRIFNKDFRKFFAEIKHLNPYVVQVTGLGLFTFLSNFLLSKKVPRAYYAYDIIAYYDQKNNPKKLGIRSHNLSSFSAVLKRLEKYYFKNFDGIIHKGPKNELSFLDYSVNAPDFTLSVGCLEDWTHPPKKKSMKEIHLALAGPPVEGDYYTHPFKDLIKEITSQKIHLHTYGHSGPNQNYFLNEEKNNPYFHYHERLSPEELNKELSNYHYGLIPDFFNSRLDPLWGKTSMGHKISNIIEAGLPVIVSSDLKVMSDLVKEYKIGICIDYKDLKNLRTILEKGNYKRLQNNVKLTQRKIAIKKVSRDLAHFYETIAQQKAGMKNASERVKNLNSQDNFI